MCNTIMYEEISMPQIHIMLKELLIYINNVANDNNITYYLHAGTALGAVRHGDLIPWDEDADIIVPINEYNRFINLISKGLDPKYDLLYQNAISDVMQAKIILRGDKEGVICLDIFPLIGVSGDKKKQEKLTILSARIRKIYKLKRLKYSDSSTKLKSIAKKTISFCLSVFSDKILYNKFERLILFKYDYNVSPCVTNPCGGYGMKNVVSKDIYGKPVMRSMFGCSFPVAEKTDEYLTHYYGEYMKLPPLEVREKLMNMKKRIKKQ